MKFWTGDEIVDLKEGQIFVFGSNPEGRHGSGAAKAAMKFGAIYGVGRGIQGNTYGLITKNLKAGFTEKSTGIKYEKEGYQSVSKEQISKNIDELYEYVRNNPEKMFIIVYKNETWDNGSPKKSLNGYTGEEMFELFTKDKEVPNNIAMHDSFKPLAKKWLENKQSLDNKIEQEKFTFFWRSTSPFSQWHPAIFEYKGIKFTSCEQFMMYSKAKLFGDEVVAQKIIDKNKHPLIEDFLSGQVNRYDIIDDYKTLRVWDTIQKEIKDLGKEVKNFNEDVWVSKRESIIAVANREKYNQNPDLKYKLMQTEGTTLVEASPYDRYGIGMDSSNPKSQNRNTWNGLNLLGKILTDTRIRFENENKPNNKMKI